MPITGQPGEQLQLFHAPEELRNLPSVEDGSNADGTGVNTVRQGYNENDRLRRLNRPTGTAGSGPSLQQSITKGGVEKPVILQDQGTGNLPIHGNGHHRTLGALNAGKQFVPVLYDNDYMGTRLGDQFGVAED